MRTIIVAAVTAAALASCSAAALAQQFERTQHYFLPAGGTFALRAVCPLDGRIFIRAYQAAAPAPDAFLNPLGYATPWCVNGRTGLSFTVPPGEATQDIAVWLGWDWPNSVNFKLRLEPDCAEGSTTTCVLSSSATTSPEVPALTATGRFTWGGDVDWFRLDESYHHLNDIRLTTPKPSCVAVGRVIFEADVGYLAVTGGPAGCSYKVYTSQRSDT